MIRKIAVLALLWCAACYSKGPSLGTCNVPADCTLPDGGQLPGVTCNQNNVCAYACASICALAEACVNGACELQGPRITSVTAPTTWSLRSQQVTVTAVVDDTGGPGIASAVLRIAGLPNITGVTTGTGLVRTFTFIVDGSVQTPNTEAPVAFTVVATDTGGGTTPDRAAGTGQLLIDDRGPTVNGVTVNLGVPVGPAGQQIKWFAQSQATPIDVQVAIQDNGSGVQPSSLTLVVGVTPTRIDAGTPTCTGSNPTLTCHFSVTPSSIPTSVVPTGQQRQLQFSVAGTDVAGNTVKTNQAAVGIDGKPPTITFSVGTSYPGAFADCNGGAPDGTMYCGHDGSHFWRAGDGKYNLVFTVSDTFPAPNDVGSGASASGSTCTIAGSTSACTVTFNASNNTFTFPANFATATFTSAADGSGTVSVTVNATDAVGNAATAVTVPVNVTRLKWMRSMATKIDTIKGSPVATSVPVPQVMFAGSERDSSGPLVSLAPDGAVLWRAGHTDVTAISLGNVAYSPTTQRLYVAEDNAPKLVVYAIGSGGVGGTYNCVLSDGTPGTAIGSPAILAGTTERALVSDNRGRLWSLSGTPGTGCATVGNSFTNNGGIWTSLNPPTTDGALIYVPNNGTKLSSIAFSGGSFGAVADAPSFNVLVFGPVALAGSLFFGNRSAPAQVFSYSASPTFGLIWATPTVSNPLSDALNAPVVVGPNYAFAAPLSLDGQLHAFNRATGAEVWHWETATTRSGNISAPSFGSDGAVYFGSSSPAQLFPLKVVSSAPSLANNWSSSYQGNSSQNTAGVTSPPVPATNTTVDGLPTEPVIDANGVLYFATGTSIAKVFALITDSGGPLAPVAGTTWPRVGYDNCNSSNTSFTCQ